MTQRKIVLIGKTGDGKSSSGNTILGKDAFIPIASANSSTNNCLSADGTVDDRQIKVIDMPGFFDTERNDEQIKSEIVKGLIECAPCIDAFLLVLKVGRYTRHDHEVFEQFLNTVTEDALKHTVVLFTFGEQLKGQSIGEFVKTNPKLQELVDKCGGRCHVIDNDYWNNCHSGDKSNSVQVKQLMETIDKMVEENTDKMVEENTDKMVKENIDKMVKENTDKMVKENTDKKVKENTDKKVKENTDKKVKENIDKKVKENIDKKVKENIDKKVKENIDKKVKENRRYSNELLQAMEGKIQEQMTINGGNREEAKQIVHENIMLRVVGATTGALVGALFGVGAVIILTAVKTYYPLNKLLTSKVCALTGEKGAAEAGVAALAGGVGAGGLGVAGKAAVGVLRVAGAVGGAVGGGIKGWDAAKDADSVSDAMEKAVTANWDELIVLAKKNMDLS